MKGTCNATSQDGRILGHIPTKFGQEVFECSNFHSKDCANRILVQGYTTDLTSHVGEVPGKAGQFIMAGFNGHGMPEILLTAKALASMVKDGKSFEETGLPGPFKTTQERLDDDRSFIALQ